MGKQIPIIVANWKMHKTAAEAKKFLQGLAVPKNVRVMVAPPFTAISAAAEAAKNVAIGAQNMHEAEAGAFTGEISAEMLKSAGAQFVILGHSERRKLLHESDAFIAQKVRRALSSGLLPILCIGETEAERRKGITNDALRRQLEGVELGKMMIAYEPIWAIGTGKTATPEMAEETHLAIRSMIGTDNIPLLYGGSVTPQNVQSLLKQPHIDGALVGGASLDVHQFTQIIGAL
jgi:triosephosphate isomerase